MVVYIWLNEGQHWWTLNNCKHIGKRKHFAEISMDNQCAMTMDMGVPQLWVWEVPQA